MALLLNVLLLQLAWTGSRGECAPAASDQQHRPSAMAAMHEVHVPAASALADASQSHGDCQGEMLGATCGLMAGCASAGLLNIAASTRPTRSNSTLHIAGDVTGAPLAAPQPLPPPPRA